MLGAASRICARRSRDPRAGSAWRRRRSPRPQASRRAAPPGGGRSRAPGRPGRGCGSAWRAATGGRRGTWCPSAAAGAPRASTPRSPRGRAREGDRACPGSCPRGGTAGMAGSRMCAGSWPPGGLGVAVHQTSPMKLRSRGGRAAAGTNSSGSRRRSGWCRRPRRRRWATRASRKGRLSDAADAELAQRPVHPVDRLVVGGRPGRDLLQQRVVEGRDDRRRVGRPAVEADAEPRRLAVGGDAPVVGDEVVLGILGRDAALHRRAVDADLLLSRHPALGEPIAAPPTP